jgi:hypothetical protein
MRKVTLGLANSLDNYIARKDGGSDWLHWSKEVAEISAKIHEDGRRDPDRAKDLRGYARLWPRDETADRSRAPRLQNP